jgi:archaemetzincin
MGASVIPDYLAPMHPRLLLLVLTVFVTFALGQSEKPAARPELFALRKAASKLRPLMQAKARPVEGDWLATQHEAGQTFDQYLGSNPNRPTAGRTTIYLQPIGDFSPAQEPLIAETAEFMGLYFGILVKTLARVGDAAIPEAARRARPTFGKKQFHSLYILDSVLKPCRPKDAVAVLGLTATDLFPDPTWNFVFGQASLRERVGVWSLARYGDPEKVRPLVLRRTLQVAIHETGHMLGIPHCTAFECGMNGSNSLPESDRAPLPFCSECELKLWWACGIDPVPRHEALLQFCKKHDLAREAKEWQRRIDALSAK